MPFTEEQADQIIRRLRLTWEGVDADLNITYRPNLLSKAEMDRLREAAEREDDEDADQVAELLSRAIIGWDFLQPAVKDEQGTVIRQGDPYPVNVGSLQRLGYGIRNEIMAKMAGAPDPTKNRRSATTSEVRILPAIESRSSSSASSQAATGESMRSD